MVCVFNGISVRHFLLLVQKASSRGLRLEFCLPAYTWIRLSCEAQKFPSTYSCHRIYTLIVFDFRRMSIILWKINEIFVTSHRKWKECMSWKFVRVPRLRFLFVKLRSEEGSSHWHRLNHCPQDRVVWKSKNSVVSLLTGFYPHSFLLCLSMNSNKYWSWFTINQCWRERAISTRKITLHYEYCRK